MLCVPSQTIKNDNKQCQGKRAHCHLGLTWQQEQNSLEVACFTKSSY